MSPTSSAHERKRRGTETKIFAAMVSATLLIAIAAIVFADLFSVDLAGSIHVTAGSVAAGALATVPLLVGLAAFAQTKNPVLSEFRERQIEFFAEIGFTFTLPRIVTIAVAAGVCEELFFRGFLQLWLADATNVPVAIIVSNVIFGTLHFRTTLYAGIAMMVGAYFGILFVLTGDLAAPVITHALYDLAALEYTRRAVNVRRHTRPDISSGSSVTG